MDSLIHKYLAVDTVTFPLQCRRQSRSHQKFHSRSPTPTSHSRSSQRTRSKSRSHRQRSKSPLPRRRRSQSLSREHDPGHSSSRDPRTAKGGMHALLHITTLDTMTTYCMGIVLYGGYSYLVTFQSSQGTVKTLRPLLQAQGLYLR